MKSIHLVHMNLKTLLVGGLIIVLLRYNLVNRKHVSFNITEINDFHSKTTRKVWRNGCIFLELPHILLLFVSAVHLSVQQSYIMVPGRSQIEMWYVWIQLGLQTIPW